MSWQKLKIKDVCDVYDGPHATPPKSDEGPIYLGISSIRADGSIDYENSKRISYEDFPKWTKRVTPQKDDVVFSYEANLESYAIIPKGFEGCLGRRMAIMRPKRKKILPRFLYYYMHSSQWNRTIAERTVLGATVNRIPIATYPEFPIEVPDLDIQKSIVAVLGAYDDLIENNRKQVSLLEEAAQRLYKEWFVDLRFPGYENAEIIHGVPTGWKRSELDDLVYQSGCSVKKADRGEFGHYLPIDSIPSKAITCWESDSIINASSSLISFRRDDFLFGAMRPYFHKVIIAPYKGLTRSTCFVLSAIDENYWAYAYMTLFAGDCVRYATAISVGTTMPYVRWDDFRHMPVLLPTKAVAQSFEQLFQPIRNCVELLTKQNAELSEARNRILLKLMSAEK